LDEFATKLVEGHHYAADDVAKRREAVRFWNFLKKIMFSQKTFSPYFFNQFWAADNLLNRGMQALRVHIAKIEKGSKRT
jgi:hypothetical protein